MGRIVTFVEVENPSDIEKRIECDALIDNAASHMVLQIGWRARLGELRELGIVDMERADHSLLRGTVCGPVQIQIEGFRPIFSKIVFVDMKPEDGKYEPLVGYIVLE